jgi:hypothetical protein
VNKLPKFDRQDAKTPRKSFLSKHKSRRLLFHIPYGHKGLKKKYLFLPHLASSRLGGENSGVLS